MPLPALAVGGAGAVGQLSVTGLLTRVLGSVPISTGGYRKWGSSKQRGIRIDTEIDNYVAYGTTPKLKESLAILARLQREGVSLISTQERYERVVEGQLLVGKVDGVGITRKGERVIVEIKSGFRRSRCRSKALPSYLLSSKTINDNQRTRALLQLSTYCGLSSTEKGLLLIANEGGECSACWLRSSLEGVPHLEVVRRLVRNCPPS